MFISQAYAQTAGEASSVFGAGIEGFLPLILIFVVFYFFLIRPQQKKMKEHRSLVSNMRRGDRIVTSGGIIGVITKVVSDTEVQVEIADGVRVRVIKSTVSDILQKTEPSEDAEDDKDDKKK